MGKIIKKRIEYGGSSNSAENIKYDDTKNVKEAINEVKSEIADVNSNLIVTYHSGTTDGNGLLYIGTKDGYAPVGAWSNSALDWFYVTIASKNTSDYCACFRYTNGTVLASAEVNCGVLWMKV